MSNCKKVPYPVKHKDHELAIINGKWGPHTKKVVCLTCKGAHVMWAPSSINSSRDISL